VHATLLTKRHDAGDNMTDMLMRIRSEDERVLHLMIARRNHWLDRLMRTVTHLGDAAVVLGIVGVLLLSGNTEVTAAGGGAAFVLVVSHIFVQLLKRSISRPRPSCPTGFESLVAAPDRFSFPSGHAAASLSVALTLIPLVAAPLGACVLLLAALVGTSRCYLGVHYPGDVLAGWSLASICHAAAPSILPAFAG